MYSIVVVAMLTAGVPDPAFGGRNRGGEACLGGCQGCYGGSCYGCSGCTGCQGCCGGYGFLGIRDFFSSAFGSGSCNGCCGGCNGCSGCCGGCSGCYGSMSCYGGCMGGCQGSYSMGGYGMSSSGYEIPMGSFASMPMNSYGTMPMTPYGMSPDAMPYSMPQGNVMNPIPPLNMQNQMPMGPAPQAADATISPTQATVVVNLPADARLYVEKHLMTLTGTTRAFRTPDLTPGTKYNYTVRMEVERSGKMIEKTETITVEPGKRTQVSFADPGEGGALTRAHIAYIQ